MAEYYTSYALLFELSPGSWTDVIGDVIGDITGEVGIHGSGILDRIADPGFLKFTLHSDTPGYYIPGVGLAGFETGVKVKLTITVEGQTITRFYGFIAQDGIKIHAELGGFCYTEVVASDYIQRMLSHNLYVPEFTTQKRGDEIIALILDNMPLAPLDTNLCTGADIFVSIFDTSSVKTSALSEAAKVTLSEMGFLYVNQSHSMDTGTDRPEVLVFEGRHTRESYSTVTFKVNGDYVDAVFDDSMQKMKIVHGENYFNTIHTSVYPRKVDSSPTSILFDMESEIIIPPTETVIIEGTYKDPQQQAVSVGGMDMQTPTAANGDIIFMSDGGVAIDSYLTIVMHYGGKGFVAEITNDYSYSGVLSKFRLRGRGIYLYQMTSYREMDAALVAADGNIEVGLDLKYQDNYLVGKDFATGYLYIYKNKYNDIIGITIQGNRNQFLLAAWPQLQIGNCINVISSAATINDYFFIQGISWKLSPGGIIEYSYDLCNAAHYMEYLMIGFRLGSVNYGLLGDSTTLGF